jgi:exodeoxyribonuclease VII small subunit
MRLWRRGEALAAHCGTWLDEAEATLTARDDD